MVYKGQGVQSAFPGEGIEHAWANQRPDKAEASYARATLLPRRVKLMDAWAEYCARSAMAGGTVTPIRQAVANENGNNA